MRYDNEIYTGQEYILNMQGSPLDNPQTKFESRKPQFCCFTFYFTNLILISKSP